MIRINTLHRCGDTVTLELMGYINRTEFDILYECIESYAREGVKEVLIVANEVRSLNLLLKRDALRLEQLGLTLRFQQLPSFVRLVFEEWDLAHWIDD